jgi:hypothetical protein
MEEIVPRFRTKAKYENAASIAPPTSLKARAKKKLVRAQISSEFHKEDHSSTGCAQVGRVFLLRGATK